ncbi:hypothetical protein MNBD_PLANCTO03-442 [hydrothermal vent metagenome]|uniref:Glycosyltransferase 2-like domain-containing protein n=1 Tax=hydrothermal vent metagenome TaxID=652676 RepID=A0A3B1E577_9ZZZZ
MTPDPSATIQKAQSHALPSEQIEPKGVRTPNVAVAMVTWNRKAMVARVLEDLSKQTFPPDHLDVVVCDNASTDGTLQYLRERFNPERIVENPTTRAHKPAFKTPKTRSGPNTLGFRSLTIVRNMANFGGCGGFNTDFAYIERVLDTARAEARPDFVWLVDDDVRMPPETCERLVRTAQADPTIGLVGTRTVHIDNPAETIETTIYFNPQTGLMDDHPPPGHRLEASHRAWAAEVGGPKGEHDYTGLREVDVVSACSMLARWSAVREVGFWDWRYFIYCDDADWCMRFAKAGHKVALNLDATVLHTPWHYKLTPARLYYAQRNVIWMMEKVLPTGELRRVVARRMWTLLRDSMHAMLMRRQFHAEIIRRTAKDVCVGRTGKLDFEGPPTRDLGPALDEAGLLTSSTRIAFLCNDPRSLEWAKRVRAAVRVHATIPGKAVPKFVEIVRNDVPGAETEPPPGVERVVYSSRKRSRLRRMLSLLGARPDAAIVFEQVNDFPLIFGKWNIHIDPKTLERCQVEQATIGTRLLFVGSWLRTCARCATYVARLGPFRSNEKYGGFPRGKASA